jgi:hypothetical protein
MADWPNLDVTPVRQEPGAAPPGPSTPLAPSHDPFGSRPTTRRRGWVRIVLGLAAVVAGIVAGVLGIVQAVDERARIESDAVARGVVRDGGLGEPLTFTVPAGGDQDYSVYLIFEGKVSQEPDQELAVRDTGCAATLPNERGEVTFRGARQGVSNTIGQASTVGHFSTPPGRVEIRCGYTSSTRGSRRVRPDSVRYVVTPGKPSGAIGGVLLILGGVFVALGGGFLAAWGWRGRRRLV